VILEPLIAEKYELLKEVLDERSRRLWAASEARMLGRGGISAVHRATGLARTTIEEGLRELNSIQEGDTGASSGTDARPRPRVRAPGGGRKKATDQDPQLAADLEGLVSSSTRGDPANPLRWTCKSVRKLASELRAAGHPVSHQLVATLLHEAGYSLKSNVKTKEGGKHPDRNAQFEYINREVKAAQQAGFPVISVDTKKKELVGEFKNQGREWSGKGAFEQVRVHDFVIPELGRANPYGVYDLSRNEAWVSVGTDHDTAAFAVGTIQRWWESMGKSAYSKATQLLITADGGGSNGSRVRLWKRELQRFSTESGLIVKVCHFPPGTSKWNKIEHRLFSFISMNWRGRPLTSHEVMVNLIAATTNKSGLKVRAALDNTTYPAGVKVADAEMRTIKLTSAEFHGDWNYQINP
jgi:hypothetical protein